MWPQGVAARRNEPMNKLVVSRYQGIDSLPPAYLPLFDAAGMTSFFFSHDWFGNFEATILGPGEKSRVYGVEVSTATRIPVAALVTRLGRKEESFSAPTRLEALGNYYTSLHGVVVGPDADGRAAVEALVDALTADRRLWDVLDLQPLDAKQIHDGILTSLLRRRGLVVQTYFCFGNWYLEVADRTFAEYFSGLSSGLRKNIPYYTRKLERSPLSRIEIVTKAEQLDQALQDYEKVYNSSWKVPEPFPAFIPGLVRTAAKNGWLRFGFVYVEGEAAAAQIWIVHGGTASIYKVAYDARFSKLSVGTILTAKLMQHVIDVDRVTVVDYLTGDDDYKKEWMSHRRERWGVVAFNPLRLRGAWQAIRNIGGRAMKRLAKTFRPARTKPPADVGK